MPRPHKREAPDLMKYQVVKKQRNNRNLGSECSTTLKQRRTHLAGWVFNQPASRQACLSEHLSLSQMSNPDLDSDGATSGLDNENSCLSSQHTPAATDDVALQGCPVFDVQQSPKKALRAAMMKKRFAETILKAQKNTLFDHGKANPLKMQQEKERFKSIQRKGELSNSIFFPSLVTPHLPAKSQVQYDIYVCKDPKEQALHFDFARQALDVICSTMDTIFSC
ncbi:uncharacterized protein LOC132169372 [Corylus avellana]|uniref:uncharacterized protein LOC132169372 n=1 Tax=Corylus avellana TaxID=13451 RepID=UPI00286C17CC|nr:uncharacterized protein LOC132169372 [Corylus avellana]